MLGLDKTGVDRLLLELEEKGCLHPQYKFYRENDGLKLLGQGGFSSVYEMYDEKNPALHYAAKVMGFANKSMSPELVQRTTQMQYFLGEQSENIVRVLDLWEMKLKIGEDGKLDEVWYPGSDSWEEDGLLLQIIFMERLDRVLARDKYGNTTLCRDCLCHEEEVIAFAGQIGRAIFTAHNHNILHRDIKLENIFWDEKSRQYKLGDFGIAKLVEQGNAETVVFTDGYGAPEIERRLTDSYNAAADIYSFGITLYLLLNDLKFPGSEGYHVNLVQYSPDFVFPAPAGASEAVARIIRKMCSYHAGDRYQSVEEVLMEFGRLDGSYTESGFVETDEDIETETYREIRAHLASGEDSPSKGGDRLTRQERKRIENSNEADYARMSATRLVISALLFLLLFKILSPDAAYVSAWQFWILPVMVLVESILQRIKDFYVEFGIMTIGAILYAAFTLQLDVPHIVLAVIVLIGAPSLTAGCAVGTGLWIVQLLTGRWAWLDWFGRWDLGWLIIIMLAAVMNSNAYIRYFFDKITQRRFSLWTRVFGSLGYLLFFVGIMLLLLEWRGIIVIPELVRQLHLVRVGIGIWGVDLFYTVYYNIIIENWEESTDEHMDE